MLATDTKRLRWLGIDMRPRWRRRTAVVVPYAVLFVTIIVVTTDPWPAHPYWTLLGMVVSTAIWVAVSIFRNNGVVKSFEDPLRASTGSKVFVNGLDEWARYRYDVASFDEASDAQQTELLKRYRVGRDGAG
jgi:hypothetical protein